MPDVRQKFLTDGLRLYPEAIETVANFRRIVAEVIVERVRRRAWKGWKPDPRRFKSTRSEAGDGVWVGATVPGLVEGTELSTWIEFGIWWNATELDGQRAFCLHATEEIPWLRSGMVVPPNLDVGMHESDRSYLYVIDDSASPDLGTIFDRLLAALDACVVASRDAQQKAKASTPPRSRP